MDSIHLHITEYSFRKNERARQLLSAFLGLEESECEIPINQCSQVLLCFVRNYNELVINCTDSQQKLF